jgi:HD-GYP domain-containing protein (c-di-GMP phosphodiesterase class II)
VGKSQISTAIINKPDHLTPAEMHKMKEHSALGVELMKKAGVTSGAVISGVLQHHERMDGSGYPNGASGAAIHPYARIIAVADIYDAITEDRPFQKKDSPFAAARIIAQEMFGKLDMEIATTFLEHIRDHFIGTQVYLSDGRKAEVILLGSDFTFKPIIRTESGEFIDTGRRLDIQIKEVISF